MTTTTSIYGRRRERRTAPKCRSQLDGKWKLSTADLWTAVAEAPSRAHMQRPYPREDLRENIARLYEAIWRHAIKARSATIDTTWTQLAVAMGYPKDDAAHMHGTLWRWMELLVEIGVVERAGVKDLDGAWQRLDVILVAPAGVAQSVEASEHRRTVTRRRESRHERHARREQPWRRQAGRSRAVPRWDAARQRGASPAVPGTPEPGNSRFQTPYLPTPSCLDRARDVVPRPVQAINEKTDARAREWAPLRGGLDAFERACPPEQRAALAALRSVAASGEGREALEAIRRGAADWPQDAVAAALAGWEAAANGRAPRLSRRVAGRLQRAAVQLDRLWGPGAAVDVLLDRLAELGPAGTDLSPTSWHEGEVATLAYYAAELRVKARSAVRYDRFRRGKRDTPHHRPFKRRGRA